jgi:hypothetical protein
MAKKKITPDDSTSTTTPTTPAPAPTRRRAPAKKQAAPPAPTASADDSGRIEPDRRPPDPTQDEIAIAAYFRHLNRGGNTGDELNDWIEAERELKRRR